MGISHIARHALLTMFMFGPPTLSAPESARVNMPVLFVYSDKSAPYSFQVNGQPEGILIELTELLMKQLPDVSVSHGVFPWTRAQNLVRGGQADGFVTVPTPSRLQYVDCTENPVFVTKLYILVRKNNRKIPSMKNLKTLHENRDITAITSSTTNLDKDIIAGMNVVVAPSDLLALRMLIGRRGDFFIGTVAEVRLLSEIKGGEAITAFSPSFLPTTGYHVCLRKGFPSPHLISDIDEQLKTLSASRQYEEIFRRHDALID